MAPSSAAISNLLRQAVYYHLDNNSYDNALFFAEKLTAQDPKASESTHLLALSHFRLGDFQSAFDVSRASANRGTNLGTIWVFSQSCLVLERYREGINVLEKTRERWTNKSNLGRHTASSRSLCPDEASVLCLLGKLYRSYDDKRKAAGCFEKALKLNPFMWDAFQFLCELGVVVKVPNMFRVTDTLTQAFNQDAGLASSESKESISNFMDPVPKKTSARSALDASDPFELQRTAALGSAIPSAESEENDFMTKITAARTRLTQPTTANGGPDGLETPSGSVPVPEARVSRPNFAVEPPQAPARRNRMAQPVNISDMDAPSSRMGYRIGVKRGARGQDKPNEQQQAETIPGQGGGLMRSSTTAAERKRTVSGHPVQPRQASEEPGAPQRRSARLNMFKPSAAKANSGAATIGAAASRELKKARPPITRAFRPGSSGSSVGRVVSGNRNPRAEDNGMDIDHGEASRVKEPVAASQHQAAAPRASTADIDNVKIEEALKWIMELLKKLGSGFFASSQFRCQEAIQAYMSLPRSQQETPWVLAQMGRSHYEQAGYAEAEKYFRRLRVMSPSRHQDMEVYSTILWHLKRETDLSFLAHELVDSSWTSPQAWCTLGNAWSLARDPDQALRCFKRATQLDPKFAYAFTLQGHEHVTNEEYEKALGAYRQALAADPRHYNAYYGMGKVNEKLGNYDKARIYYHSASVINPTNAVLICCVGTVLEKQKQMGLALQAFSRATELAPRAAQTRYKKARAHLAVGQLEAAQRELLVLKDLAPDEASVHFLLGKMYMRNGDTQQSTRHFTVAVALDPKASQQVKEAMESLEDDLAIEDSLMS